MKKYFFEALPYIVGVSIALTAIYFGFDIPDRDDMSEQVVNHGLFWPIFLLCLASIALPLPFTWRKNRDAVAELVSRLKDNTGSIQHIDIGFESNTSLVKENKEGWGAVLEKYREQNPPGFPFSPYKRSYVVIAVQSEGASTQFISLDRFDVMVSRRVREISDFAQQHNLELLDYRIKSRSYVLYTLILVMVLLFLTVVFGKADINDFVVYLFS